MSSTQSCGLNSWSVTQVMQWIRTNLSPEYRECLSKIESHNIDGKILNDCISDDEAKIALLRTLFPDSKDAFLRLSFFRQIEGVHSAIPQQSNSKPSNSIEQTNTETVSFPSNQCSNCGATVSSFMIDHHRRHCLNQKMHEEDDDHDNDEDEVEHRKEEASDHEEQAQEPSMVEIADNEVVIDSDVECEFCEIGYNASSIEEHRVYCGSRTEICPLCGVRDTLFNLKSGAHRCNIFNNTNNRNHNKSGDPNLEPNIDEMASNDLFHSTRYDATISSMERQLYSLEGTLCPGLSESNDQRKCHQSKKESLSKNIQKMKEILDLMERILIGVQNEGTRLRPISCSNTKIQQLICCYSSCAEFIILCGFVFVPHGGKNGDDIYLWMDGNEEVAHIGLGVVRHKKKEFAERVKNYKEWQSQSEQNVAFTKEGRWCCKQCDTLNSKHHWKCIQCKSKRKSPRHSQKRKLESSTSIESWVCAMCKYRNTWSGNRNNDQDVQCQNCQTHKIVTDLSRESNRPMKRPRLFH